MLPWCTTMTAAATAGARELPPSIVMAVVDDLGSHDFGLTGSEIKTPNVDALHANGIDLTNYYVQRLCSPTRSSFLTGRYAIHHGVDNWIPPETAWAVPSNNLMIAQRLKAANYSTHGAHVEIKLSTLAPNC
jgi:arylsulfatase I/J